MGAPATLARIPILNAMNAVLQPVCPGRFVTSLYRVCSGIKPNAASETHIASPGIYFGSVPAGEIGLPVRPLVGCSRAFRSCIPPDPPT